MKKTDLSKNTYEKAVTKKGNRGYRLEYLEDGKWQVRLEGISLIEKNGAEAYLSIADVVTFLFCELDIADKEDKEQKKKEMKALKKITKKK